MRIAHRAVWLMESRLREPLTLAVIASELGVSPFHLARAFSATHGLSPMHYLRRRRLAEAARRLGSSDARIIDVALDAGYGSQEAFTRAFVLEFRQSPQRFRQQRGGTAPIGLEAILMEPELTIELKSPRIVDLPELRLVGLSRRYDQPSSAQIPDQWVQFSALGLIGADDTTYGVCYNGDGEGNMDYLCGVEVADFGASPARLDRLTIPPQRYAVFAHAGHISEIRDVWSAVWNQGLADAGLAAVEGPDFERYGAEFDPATGAGGFEIWVPVRPA